MRGVRKAHNCIAVAGLIQHNAAASLFPATLLNLHTATLYTSACDGEISRQKKQRNKETKKENNKETKEIKSLISGNKKMPNNLKLMFLKKLNIVYDIFTERRET